MPTVYGSGFKQIAIRTSLSRPKVGSFATIAEEKDSGNRFGKIYRVSEFIYCREEFHSDFKQKNKTIVHCHKAKKGKNIAAFIRAIEKQLLLDEYSLIRPTQHNFISWIQVSSWWRKYAMRRSLFTALVRAGSYYNITRPNIDRALIREKYTFETIDAVRHFLKGNTQYRGKKTGWHRQFYVGGKSVWGPPKPPTMEEIQLLLTKPE